MNTLELKISPPALALLVCGAMWGVSLGGPSVGLSLLQRVVSSLAIAFIGGVLAFLGGVELKRAKTTINPFKPQNSSSLVTSGVYRLTRNPLYLGLVFLLLGWAVFLCSYGALVGPVFFVLYMNRFQIEPEEKILSAKFGLPYATYRSRVRRWL